MTLLSRSELPAWVTPKAPRANEIAVYWQASADIVAQYIWTIDNGRLTDPRAFLYGPNGIAPGNLRHPPEVLIAAGVEAMRRRAPVARPQPVYEPGDLVLIGHQPGRSVGYVDCPDDASHVIVMAMFVQPGDGIPTITSWRMPVDELHLLRKGAPPC